MVDGALFTMKPRARHRSQICLGTAYYVKGGKKLADRLEADYKIKIGESTKDGRFIYEKARCFGACRHAYVLIVDRKVSSYVSVESMDGILSHYNYEAGGKTHENFI